MKKIILLIFAITFISCSNDAMETISPEIVVDDIIDEGNELSEEEVELLTFNIQIEDGFLNGFDTGNVYLSNDLGEIIEYKEIVNNSTILIEIERLPNVKYDLTVEKKSNNYIDIDTFTDISSGNFILESKGQFENSEDVNVSLNNTGFPWEKINFESGALSLNASNGGSAKWNTNLNLFSGTIYLAGLSPNEIQPRYFFEQDVLNGSNIDVDYLTLPFVENSVQIEFPSEADYTIVSLKGFRAYNNLREMKNVDDSELSNDTYFFPNNIFDNYELNALLVFNDESQRQFEITKYGIPTSESFELPNFEANLISNRLSDFKLETNSEYDFSTVTYSFFNLNIGLQVSYEIHSEPKNQLIFSKDGLMNNILNSTENISSSELNYISVVLLRNNELSGKYDEFIEAVINEKSEYPSGTSVEKLRIFE